MVRSKVIWELGNIPKNGPPNLFVWIAGEREKRTRNRLRHLVIWIAAAQEMEQLGYESRPVAMGRAERLWFRLAHRPYHSGVSAFWRVREAFRTRRGRRLPDYRLVPEPA